MQDHSSKFEKVYELVRKIPRGRVTTYAAIGIKLSMSPRIVGYALHRNPSGIQTPCHRVINRDGRIAPGYAFGGKWEQKRRLEAEGIEFKNQEHLNLKKYYWTVER